MNPYDVHRKRRMVYDHNRKTFPLRLYDRERQKGKAAATWMQPGTQPGVSTWDKRPWTEADFWRTVGLDWADHIGKQAAARFEEPPGVRPWWAKLPSQVVAELQERIAQLEERLRAAGIDPKAAAPAETRKRRRAANG